MKNILTHLFPFSMIKSLIGVGKETWVSIGKNILIVLAPLIFVTVAFNILILMGSFLLWQTPNSLYFPFLTGESIQGHFDRLLLLIGVLIAVFK